MVCCVWLDWVVVVVGLAVVVVVVVEGVVEGVVAVVVVDEVVEDDRLTTTSWISLSEMSGLSRLLLLGNRQQLPK